MSTDPLNEEARGYAVMAVEAIRGRHGDSASPRRSLAGHGSECLEIPKCRDMSSIAANHFRVRLLVGLAGPRGATSDQAHYSLTLKSEWGIHSTSRHRHRHPCRTQCPFSMHH